MFENKKDTALGKYAEKRLSNPHDDRTSKSKLMDDAKLRGELGKGSNMLIIDDEHKTGVAAEFDSSAYTGTFEIVDERIPTQINDSNKELFTMLEMVILANVRKVLDSYKEKK